MNWMSDSNPSLLILAAGMGSRYGGLKQLDSFGPNGETIIDYSVYDALQAGFRKLIFIIRKSFEKEFVELIESRWKGKAEMHYVFQELDELPPGFECPPGRSKPWGTGHAVWVAKNTIHESFGVINADDFYGRDAMNQLFGFLKEENDTAVIAYLLKNTLSEHGAVNRGVCIVDENNNLENIRERKNIHKSHEIYFESDGKKHILNPETPVSMNMWAFRTNYFHWAEEFFRDFLQKEIKNGSAEFYIPDLIQHLIDKNRLHVKVLKSTSNWIGVTFQEDKPAVEQAFKKMIADGLYPAKL